MLEYLLLKGDDITHSQRLRTCLHKHVRLGSISYTVSGGKLSKYFSRNRPDQVIDLPVPCIAIRESAYNIVVWLLGSDGREYYYGEDIGSKRSLWPADLEDYLVE